MTPLIPSALETRIREAGIIAVLVVDDPENAVKLAQTLLDNGISAMELTLRTESALESLRRIKKEVPQMLAGVGTVLTTGQVTEVTEAGVAFAVAPGFNPPVVDKAIEAGLPFGPGISTPSELEGAVEKGCKTLKYFHAEGLGGPSYLKGINSPYSFLNLNYIPLGGLKVSNMRNYLEMPEVLALGGSWIAPRNLIQNGDWDTIAKNAAESVRIMREVRS